MKLTKSILLPPKFLLACFFGPLASAQGATIISGSDLVVLVSGSSSNGALLSGSITMPMESILPASGSFAFFYEFSMAALFVSNHPNPSYNGTFRNLQGGGLRFNNVLLEQPEVIEQSIAIVNSDTGAFLYASNSNLTDLFFLGDSKPGPAFTNVTWTVVPEPAFGCFLLGVPLVFLGRRRQCEQAGAQNP